MHTLPPDREHRPRQPQQAPGGNRRLMIPHGLNIFGPTTMATGIAESLRGFIQAVRHSGTPCTVHGISRHRPATASPAQLPGNLYPVNCLYFNPGSFHKEFLPSHGLATLQDRYNIGFWYWETDRLRRSWRACLPYYQEIWTGSEFCRKIFQNQSSLPVVVIPPVVVPDQEAVDPLPLTIPSGRFVVLCCYDYRSSFQRKNPAAVVRAFQRAFPRQDDVLLVLKARTAGLPRPLARQHASMTRFARGWWPFTSGDKRILLLEDDLTRNQINALLRRSDCLISLHRSEGFGMHLAEALSLGTPVVATGYSGNMDFMREENSYLVRYKLVRVRRGNRPYPAGSHWAEPDVDHAVELLQHVYRHREEARQKAQCGAQFLRQYHSLQHVGQLLKAQLDRVFAQASACAKSPIST